MHEQWGVKVNDKGKGQSSGAEHALSMHEHLALIPTSKKFKQFREIIKLQVQLS